MPAEKLSKIVPVLFIYLLCLAPGLPITLVDTAEFSLSLQASSAFCRLLPAAPATLSLELSSPAPGSDWPPPGFLETQAPGKPMPRYPRISDLAAILAAPVMFPGGEPHRLHLLNPLSPSARPRRDRPPATRAAPPPEPPAGLPAGLPAAASRPDRILTSASHYLGTPYRRGGSLRTGQTTDCSGFVQFIYQQADIDLPRSSPEQAQFGKVVAHTLDFAKMKPGDLLFFDYGGRHLGHVGIYVGDGKMIHASTRRRRVIISDLRQPAHEEAFVVAKRLPAVQFPN